GGDVLEPRIELGDVFREATGPDPIHQHATTVRASRWIVDALYLKSWTTRAGHGRAPRQGHRGQSGNEHRRRPRASLRPPRSPPTAPRAWRLHALQPWYAHECSKGTGSRAPRPPQ